MLRAYFLLCFLVILNSSPSHGAPKISVSGFSSGAYAAVQYQVTYSSKLIGAGIIAGGPYYCANGEVSVALTSCMADPSLIVVSELVAATKYAEELNSIDDTSNLKNHKVWMFSGTKDTVVKQGVMEKLQEYYGNYVLPANTKSVFNISAEHAYVTNSYGNACDHLGEDYINNCHIDAAGEILKHIHGDLKPAVNWTEDNIVALNQQEFITFWTPQEIGMYTKAYVYIPTKCQNEKVECHLHIVYHGCQQSVPIIGNKFYTKTGYNGWGEANNIMILYPQADKNELNPDSCFDWWGYTGSDYATKLGEQNTAVRGMMDYLIHSYNGKK